MTTKPTDWTDWIQITIGFEGRAIHGSYAVEDGMVKVKVLAAKEQRGLRASQTRFGWRCGCCVSWRRREKHKGRRTNSSRFNAACKHAGSSRLLQQLRQLGDICRNPPRPQETSY